MNFKIFLKLSLLVFVAGIISIIFLANFNISANDSQVQSAVLAEQTSIDPPVHLKIPSINVDATIEQVGVAPDGSMDVPSGPDNAAWFDLGPHPGEIGSAVIDGHSGYKNNRPAIFDNLHKLVKGDKIYVEDASGASTTFIVRDFHSYDPKANATAVFSSTDGLSHLNLITCSGAWNELARTHSNRLVVFADKVPE